MPLPRPLPTYYPLVQAAVRSISWVTALVAVLLLAYVGKTWSDKGQVIVAGVMGASIAMLNDSWEVIAITDTWQTLPRLSSSRRVLHDLFSLALSVGGTIMLWVSNVRLGDSNEATFESRREQRYVMAALWGLLAQVGWRLVHILWGCFDCSQDARANERRRRRRRRRRRHRDRDRDLPVDPWFEITGYRV